MDEQDPFAAFLDAPAPPSDRQTGGVGGDVDPFAAYLQPETNAPRVLEQARRDGWDWSRVESGLKEYGLDPQAYAQFKPEADLNAARREVASGGKGLSTSQAYRRSFQQFSSLVGSSGTADNRVVSLK